MTQATPDTFPAGFATTAVNFRTRGGALAINRDLLIPDPEIGGGRDIADAYLGAAVWSGDIEFYARLRSLPVLLRAALGLNAVGPTGAQEIETLTITGAPTGGTFTLTYSAQTTTALPYNATAAQIQAALQALSNIGDLDVIVTGGPFPATAVVVSFVGALSGTVTGAPLTATPAFTGGTTPALGIVRTQTGLSATPASNGYQHTISPSDLAQLPFLSVEEQIGAGLEVYRYTDGVVNTLHLESDANGYLMGTVGMIARKQTAGTTPMTAGQLAAQTDESAMIVGTNITITYNGVSLPAKSFNFDFNNNFEDDDFRLGSFNIGDLTPKRREVTVGVSIRESSNAMWRQAAYGGSALVTPGGLITKQGLVITMSTYETLPGVTSPLTPFTLTLNFPSAALTPYAYDPSGDDVIESDLTFQIVRNQSYRPLVYCYVVNDVATIV
jgi:hypothetical protein